MEREETELSFYKARITNTEEVRDIIINIGSKINRNLDSPYQEEIDFSDVNYKLPENHIARKIWTEDEFSFIKEIFEFYYNISLGNYGYDSDKNSYKILDIDLVKNIDTSIYWLSLAHDLSLYKDDELFCFKYINYSPWRFKTTTRDNETNSTQTSVKAGQDVLLNFENKAKYNFMFISRGCCSKYEYNDAPIEDILSITAEKVFASTKIDPDCDEPHLYQFSDRFYLYVHNGTYIYYFLGMFSEQNCMRNPIKISERVKRFIERNKEIIFPFSVDSDLQELYDENTYIDYLINIELLFEKFVLGLYYDKISRAEVGICRDIKKFNEYKKDLNSLHEKMDEYNKRIKDLKLKIRLASTDKSEEKQSTKIIDFLNRYVKMQILNKYEVIPSTNSNHLYLALYFNPCSIVSFEDANAVSYLNGLENQLSQTKTFYESLQRNFIQSLEDPTDSDERRQQLYNDIVKNYNIINWTEHHIKYIKDVIKGEDYRLFLSPHKVLLTLSEHNIDFRTSLLSDDPNQRDMIANGYSNSNRHALYAGGEGCRGSFNYKFQEASASYNVLEYIAYAIQYIQSVNPIDPIGKYSFLNSFIVDGDNKVVLGSVPFLNYNDYSEPKCGFECIGHDIYELFDFSNNKKLPTKVSPIYEDNESLFKLLTNKEFYHQIWVPKYGEINAKNEPENIDISAPSSFNNSEVIVNEPEVEDLDIEGLLDDDDLADIDFNDIEEELTF